MIASMSLAWKFDQRMIEPTASSPTTRGTTKNAESCSRENVSQKPSSGRTKIVRSSEISTELHRAASCEVGRRSCERQ
jgi:hypothetical protein